MTHRLHKQNVTATLNGGLKTGTQLLARLGMQTSIRTAPVSIVIVNEAPGHVETHAELRAQAQEAQAREQYAKAAELFSRALDVYEGGTGARAERHYLRRSIAYCNDMVVYLRILAEDNKRRVLQDGAQFYDEATGELIAQYPYLVRNDADLQGAIEARRMFLMEHLDCRCVGP